MSEITYEGSISVRDGIDYNAVSRLPEGMILHYDFISRFEIFARAVYAVEAEICAATLAGHCFGCA